MIFYALAGLAVVALVYAHAASQEYTIWPDEPGVEPYTVDMLPMGTLLIALALIYTADSRGGSKYVPRLFVSCLVCLSFVVCVLFGVLWYMLGQYPAAIATACILATAAYMLPRTVRFLRRQSLAV